jgi:uncharacterized protein (DUF39 family)
LSYGLMSSVCVVLNLQHLYSLQDQAIIIQMVYMNNISVHFENLNFSSRIL